MFCNHCGASIEKNKKFCDSCGRLVEQSDKTSDNIQTGSNTITYNSKIEPIDTPITQTNQNTYNDNLRPEQNYNNYNNYNNYSNPNNQKSSGNGILKIVLIFLIIFGIITLLIIGAIWAISQLKSEDINYLFEKEPEASVQSAQKNKTSYVETYLDQTITFNVPATFIEDKEVSDSEVRYFTKQDKELNFYAIICQEFGGIDDFIDDVNQRAERIKSESTYKNISVSDLYFNVNGKSFLGKLIEYSTSYSTESTAYIACELDEYSTYHVQIEDYHQITQDELNDLLTIKISD